MALKNDGRYIKDGKIADVTGDDLMWVILISEVKHPLTCIRASAKPYYFSPAYNLVCYANRDSSVFKEYYGLKDVKNLVRGSLR